MTTDDYERADRRSPPSEDGTEGKNSRRGRLKDALSRTRTKLQHVREEREAKKHSKDALQPESKLDDDVNDFLAAGRTSFASSRPSLGSVTVPPGEDSLAVYESSSGSPRPSTSDSKSQASPRRGPPITVPRIDVSASSRFPNARTVHPDDRLPQVSDVYGSSQSGSLLAPEYKSRSMSSTSILSKERKQRIRGLSVGFADAPPVVIGEGGDEAQAPPMEISRAKARARSASPQGRRPYPDQAPIPQAVGRVPMPSRGISEYSAVGFIPKPLARVQTGAMSTFQRQPRGPHDDDLFPTSPSTEQKPPMPPRNTQPFQPISQINTGSLDLAKEFEMTLGMRSPSQTSPVAGREPLQPSSRIAAPKPQRAPPSYDILEEGGKIEANTKFIAENYDSQQHQQSPTQVQSIPEPIQASHRQPMAAHEVPNVGSYQSYSRPNPQISSQPPMDQQQEVYYPPPPQRQTTTVRRNIQKLEPIQSRSRQNLQETSTPPKAPLQLVTEVDDGYRSFAERQRGGFTGSMLSNASNIASPEPATIRHVVSREYEQSPSNYTGSKEATPHTATSPQQMTKRFYERQKDLVPEGMI